MEELSKDDLINKWKTERNKLLSELSFCSEQATFMSTSLLKYFSNFDSFFSITSFNLSEIL